MIWCIEFLDKNLNYLVNNSNINIVSLLFTLKNNNQNNSTKNEDNCYNVEKIRNKISNIKI